MEEIDLTLVSTPWGLRAYEAARAARVTKDERFVACGPTPYVYSGGVICKEKI